MKNNDLKAIVGASIGGCSTAFFLEELFNEQNEKNLEIDVFEKENSMQTEGKISEEKSWQNNNLFHYRGHVYDLNPLNFVNMTDFYIKKFGQKSGIFELKIKNTFFNTRIFAQYRGIFVLRPLRSCNPKTF